MDPIQKVIEKLRPIAKGEKGFRPFITPADAQALCNEWDKKGDNVPEVRKPGRILPTEEGNTVEAEIELVQQHETAFREAVLSISSWVRTAHCLDRAGFFQDLRKWVDNWEKDEIAAIGLFQPSLK